MPDNKVINKSLYIDEIKEVDGEDRTLLVVGSKEVVDRESEIVKIDGVQLKNFKKNPVILLNHSHHDFPIGKAVGKKVWVEDKKLMFKIQFATKEENPKADIAFKLYKGGYMNAFSIGFIPNWEKMEYPDSSKGKGATRIFHESELLELSAVTVPANADALNTGKAISKAVSDGIIESDELSVWESKMDKSLDTKDKDTSKEDKSEEDNLIIKLREAEIRIKELELQLKEEELEDNIEEDFDSYLTELFSEDPHQADSSQVDADVPQTDEEVAGELLTILNNEENDND